VAENELVDLDPEGNVVARRPRPESRALGAGPAGLFVVREALDADGSLRVLVGDATALTVPPAPHPLLQTFVAGGPEGALVAWSELGVRSSTAARAPGSSAVLVKSSVMTSPSGAWRAWS
jgi:hypothetical protein